MKDRVCVECGDEDLELMLPISRLTEDDDERPKTISELWWIACASKLMAKAFKK